MNSVNPHSFAELYQTLQELPWPAFLESISAEEAVLREALELSATPIQLDPAQLAAQVVGRLAGHPAPRIQALVEQARAWRGRPWLCPAGPTLKAPGDPLTQTLLGHTEFIGGLVVLPDGETLVSASEDATMRVWHLPTGALLRTLNHASHPAHHWRCVNHLALARDGRRLLSASDDCTAKVWDTATWTVLHTLEGHADYVSEVAGAAEGRVVSVSKDGTVRVWDIETGAELAVFEGHGAWVSNVAVTPDGRVAITGSINNVIRAWDVVDLQPLPPFFQAEGREHTRVVIGSLFLGARNTGPVGHFDNPSAMAVTPDGERLVTAQKRVIFWDMEARQQISRGLEHPLSVDALLLLDEGRTLVTAADAIRLWDVERAALRGVLADHTKRVTALAVTPDERILVSGSEDNTIRVWDVTRPLPNPAYTGHAAAVDALCFSADGRWLLSAAGDGRACLWDTATGRKLHAWGGHAGNYVQARGFTPEGRALTTSNEGDLRVWDVETGDLIHALQSEVKNYWIDALAVTPDGRYAVVGASSEGLTRWNIETGAEIVTFAGRTKQVSQIALTPDGRFAATACYLGNDAPRSPLQIWDVEAARLRHELWPAPHPDPEKKAYFTQVAVLPDGARVVGATNYGDLYLCDLESGQQLARWQAHPGFLQALHLCEDGRLISSALENEEDVVLRTWDLATQVNLRTLTSPYIKPRLPEITADGRWGFYAHKRKVALWDLEGDRHVAQFYIETAARTVAIAPAGAVMAVGEESGRVHILRINNGEW